MLWQEEKPSVLTDLSVRLRTWQPAELIHSLSLSMCLSAWVCVQNRVTISHCFCALIRIRIQYIFGKKKSAHNSPAHSSSIFFQTVSLLSSAKYWITKPEQIIGIYLAFLSVFVQTSWGTFFNISIFTVFVAVIWALPAHRDYEKPDLVTHGKLSNGLEGHTYWLPQTGSG